MPSLVVHYWKPADQVAKLWNASAGNLGLKVLRPLERGVHGWDVLGSDLNESDIFVSFCTSPCEFSRLELDGRNIEPRWLEQLLEFDLKPAGVFVSNWSSDFAEEAIVCAFWPCEPAAMLDAIESSWILWGTRTRQALHNSLLSPLDEWQATARERGFPLRAIGDYQILDVHFTDDVPWPEKADPVTGLPADRHEDVEQAMLQPVGSRILLVISGVGPNPRRQHSVWLETLPRVAQVLSADLKEGDLLARFYTPREFVILKAGISCSEAPGELERLRQHLQERMKPMRLRGWLTCVSWPDEVNTLDDMMCYHGWDKLRDREQALEL